MRDDPIQHDVDMEAYDTMMEEAGFVFVDDLEHDDEVEVEITFLAEQARGGDWREP